MKRLSPVKSRFRGTRENNCIITKSSAVIGLNNKSHNRTEAELTDQVYLMAPIASVLSCFISQLECLAKSVIDLASAN